MKTTLKCAIILLLLSGCAGLQGKVEDVGGETFDALERASETALKGTKRYRCNTARIGPLLEELNTQEKRDAWGVICDKTTTLPPLPE